EIIEKLYEASCADVTIDLVVRGICCLRPKVPGLSDNIRVISIVGRFLEHSRIFYFENAGQPRVFLSSADWMPRNFYRRIELAFPVENPALRDQIINEVLPSFLHDRVKARELQPDGKYRRLKPEGSEPRAHAERRKFKSGHKLTPRAMVEQIKPLVADWEFDAISIGFPSPVRNGRIVSEPKHLGKGWVRFDFQKALGKPLRIINDAAMQAL